MPVKKDKKHPINLKPDGRVANVEVKLTKKKPGKLYFFFEPVDGNNTPLKYVSAANRAGFGPNSQPKVLAIAGKGKHRSKRGAAFQVSVCGLDKFKVYVSMERPGSKKTYVKEGGKTAVFEVWRKLYYSYRTMDPSYVSGANGVNFATVTQEYNKYGIDLEEVPAPSKQIPHRDLLEADEVFTHKKVMLAPPSHSIKVHPVTKTRQEARLFFIDQLVDTATETFADESQGQATIQIWTTSLSSRVNGDVKLVWPKANYIKGNVGQVPIANLISAGAVKRDGNLITIDLTKNAQLAAKVTANQKIRWEVTVKMVDGGLNGFAYEELGIIVIAARNLKTQITNPATGKAIGVPVDRKQKPKHSTVVHEMGHGLKLVHEKYPLFKEKGGGSDGELEHPFYFDIGSGGHCGIGSEWKRATTLGKVKDALGKFFKPIFGYNGSQLPVDKNDEPIKSGTCVMFYQGWAQRPLTFCEHCLPLVRAADLGLSATGMQWPASGPSSAMAGSL